MLREIELVPRDPPPGVTLGGVQAAPRGLTFRLAARKGAVPVGFADNLIVEVFRNFAPRGKGGPRARRNRRVSIGFLPAIPIEILPRDGG